MLWNAKCLCTFYSFLRIHLGAIAKTFTAVRGWPPSSNFEVFLQPKLTFLTELYLESRSVGPWRESH